VGEPVLEGLSALVRARKGHLEAARERLLVKRGRYVEFNLVYDAARKVRLQHRCDPDAYPDELAPLVRW